MAVKAIDDLKPVYLIYGEEDLLLERALLRLKDRIGKVADLDFNYDVFDGDNADAYAVVAAANTLPFGSERRLVVVRDVDRMNAAGQTALAEYAADPAPSACLVLVAHKMRKDSRLFKAVAALGGTAEYSAPKRGEYPGWVVDLFASKGRLMARDGAAALVSAVGRDLRRLEIEAEKILAFAGERTDLGRDDVTAVVVQTATASIFDFTNALGARNCSQALEVLGSLLADGQELTGILAMAVRHLRTLIGTRAVLDRGGAQGDVQREVGMADWQAKNAIEQARRYSAAELSRALRDAADLEAKMKTGRGEPRVILEVWVAGMCRRES